MRVIFITREGYNLSGARVRCYNFARELRKHGVDTDVFSFADHLGAAYAEEELRMSNTDKMRYNIEAFKRLLKREKESIFFLQRLNYHALAPFFVSLLRRNQLIFDCDDWNIRENPVYHFGLIPSSGMEFFTRCLARYARACIAASAFLRDYLGRFNNKVYLIPTGADTEIFKPALSHKQDSSRINLCWIGTVYHEDMYQNVMFIIEAFNALARRYSNIFLNIAGEGRYLGNIRAYAESSPCRGRITIDGWIHPDGIPAYLDKADICLFPLIQNTKFNQAKSPTKLFEYMAMAKPTVASRIGEAGRIIVNGENGFLADTKEGFISRLDDLICFPDLRQQMGNNARQSIENNYSLKIIGKRLQGILDRLFKVILYNKSKAV